MTTAGTPKTRGLIANSISLLSMANITSILGFVFWTLCARSVSSGAIGIANTVISAMTLVAIVCIGGFLPSLARLLPGAGPEERSGLCSTAFVFTAIVSGIAGAGGALLLPNRLHATVGTGWLIVLLTLGAMGTAMQQVIFSSFLGLRRAELSLVAGTTAAIFRLAAITTMLILGVLAVSADTGAIHTILIIWVISMMVSVALSLWLLNRAAPGFRFRPRPVWLARMRRSVGWDHIAVLAVRAPVFVIPILAASIFQPTQLGHLAVTALVGSVFLSVASAVSNSLMADCADDPGRLQAQARRASRLIGLLLFVPVVGTCVFAKEVLSLFGSDYAEASSLLILLLLCTFPDALINVSISILRVQQQLRIVTALTVTGAIMMIIGAWILMRHIGLIGAGVAALTSQTIIAVAFVSVRKYRFLTETIPVPLRSAVPMGDRLVGEGHGQS